MTMVWLDEIMSGAVHSCNKTESDACTTDDETEVTQTSTAPTIKQNSKERTVPMENFRWFRVLLPMATSHLSNCIINSVHNSLCVEQRDILKTKWVGEGTNRNL